MNLSEGLLCYIAMTLPIAKDKKNNKFNKLGLDFTGLEMSRQTAELGVARQQKSITVFELKKYKMFRKSCSSCMKERVDKGRSYWKVNITSCADTEKQPEAGHQP